MTPENERENVTGGDARVDDGTSHAAPGPNGSGHPEAGGTGGGADRAGGAAGIDGDEASLDAAADADPQAPADADADADADRERSAGADETLSLEDRLAAAEARAEAHWDRLVRLQAEMENQRKRAQRDVANARKFALEGIAGDLLPVKDSLELGIRAASAEEASLASLLEGSELTLKMLAQVLEKHAIAEVNPEGERFDPEFHQAMSMQDVEGVPPNTVTGVMQKGYTLNDRLIRPALVMVSK